MEQRSGSKDELRRHNCCTIFLFAIGFDNFLIGPYQVGNFELGKHVMIFFSWVKINIVVAYFSKQKIEKRFCSY